MGGLVGDIGSSNAVDVLVPALKRLEHRGYDSADVATTSRAILPRASQLNRTER